MEVEIVKSVQSIASGFLDVIFWCITKLGEETFFILMLLGIYLLYSKAFALKYSFYYLISVGINTIVKVIIKRPRPYVASNQIKNRLPASNYSFPSGHSQGFFVQTTTIGLEINDKSDRKGLKITYLVSCIVVGLLIMISRLYWGQHYLTDVIIGAMFGLSIPFVVQWVISIIPSKIKSKLTPKLFYLLILLLCSVGFVVFLVLDIRHIMMDNRVYKFLGIFLALSVGYFVDEKYIKYQSNVFSRFTILRAGILYGSIIVLYALINWIIDIDRYLYFVVYLFLGLFCTIIIPLIFKKIFKNREISNGSNNK